MEIRDFIRARLDEWEEDASAAYLMWSTDFEAGERFEDQLRAVVKSYRDILDCHDQWVTMLETPIRIDPDFREYNPISTDSYVMRASSEIKFLTERAYRAQFGTEPPTTPMIRAIAAVWQSHDDYQSEWSI